ncbi:putative uncharacterized protein CXorf58 homolog isoform X3 [Rana temporaria]|uniref:putative uncharacterized protein CXorf58 homolog isoform X3 n=1 Tax=Rana temporaria TaxID=8407 RepID=UPI001AAD0C3C|nr:putative uncharacterized protein CXorf58 homolog isoform X3 [Rana temporaria]
MPCTHPPLFHTFIPHLEHDSGGETGLREETRPCSPWQQQSPSNASSQKRYTTETHMGQISEALLRMEVGVAAICIQRAWRCHHNRKLFRLLKHAIRAAEKCATYGILKKVSPLEAELLKDPGMQCKVRFRFAGFEFPPFIVFKIFHRSGNHNSRYISGKRVISPSSEAAVDACKLMGHRTYYDQVIYDQLEHQTYKVTDAVDVATFKDYMQYISHLDEMPAHLGGRDNCWRRLSLKNMPRTTIMYDIVNYAESGTISDRLKDEIKLLLQIPRTEDIQQRQISAITQYRSPAPPPSSAISAYLSSHYSVAPRNTSRRSHKARLKVQKMKRVYGLGNEGQDLTDTGDVTQRRFLGKQNTLNQAVFSDDDWEEEAEKLYAWSQGLSLEEPAMASPLHF